MKRNCNRVLLLAVVLSSFFLMCEGVWAFKNVCRNCRKIIQNQDLTACPFCGRVMNKCLNCGYENPVKNDHCEKCHCSLAESRVSRGIDKETRDDLQLDESPRELIEIELRQIDEKVLYEGLTPELAARQVELLTKMGWWSKANSKANEFKSQFPEAEQSAQVATFRVTALRHLGYLALTANEMTKAREYLRTALSIDPTDKKSQNLLKMAGGSK